MGKLFFKINEIFCNIKSKLTILYILFNNHNVLHYASFKRGRYFNAN